jgi:alkanesulfonate monooxygenase SsuD/methylene tetrahydromethanopterin reductase-like flavin-dependent oxidoreductase (luciferase family)
VNIGVYLPTFSEETVSKRDGSVAANAKRAEALGFASLWTIDHLLPTSEVHATSWYDPLISLAHAGAVTTTIELGTGTLVAGMRNPITLAKQLSSLAALAGPRVTLGASSGWYAGEYEVLGYDMRERRRRTDECLEAVRRLLSDELVSSDGDYWRFQDVALVPRPAWHLPILVGGGSRLPAAGAGVDVPVMARSVLDRIVSFDGWLAPCAGTEAVTLHDLEVVQAAVRDRPQGADGFRYVHVQWTYIVDTDDREKALAIQLERFKPIAGAGRSNAHLEECYLLGSTGDIRNRISRIAQAGFDDLAISLAVNDPEQLERLAALTLSSHAPTA